jgi:Ca2+/Na+ antiporter
MESINIIDIIINEPIYLAIVLFLSLIIIFSILKKLFKVMIFGLSVLIVYIIYLIYTGQELPGDIEVDPIKDSIEYSIEEAIDTIDQMIEKNN